MSNVFITISKLFLFLLNFLSSNKFLQQIAVKSNAKGESHTQKRKKTTKGGSKGQKAVCKIEKGKAQNVSKAKERGKGAKNNIKKVMKRLLKQKNIAKKRRLPQKDSE